MMLEDISIYIYMYVNVSLNVYIKFVTYDNKYAPVEATDKPNSANMVLQHIKKFCAF